MSEFESEMTRLRRDLLAMAATVEHRVGRMVESVLSFDAELAETVRKGDREVDVMELDIDGECMRLLALHSPVAGDLRFIVATLRINQELERIADLAKGVAKRIRDLSTLPAVDPPTPLCEVAEATGKLFSTVISALSNDDMSLAEQVRRDDAAIDAGDRAVSTWVVSEWPTLGGNPQIGADILQISRSLERIGDQCTNIAEEVIFAVGGQVVRHTSPE